MAAFENFVNLEKFLNKELDFCLNNKPGVIYFIRGVYRNRQKVIKLKNHRIFTEKFIKLNGENIINFEIEKNINPNVLFIIDKYIHKNRLNFVHKQLSNMYVKLCSRTKINKII